ncbi:transmembrane protein 179B-like [Diadema setosum]|uniref:transmembrane protein 179B-like n=1 Tax=Diadema setosum TaxID=31175 RepID=UPI003B3B5879
MGLLRSLTIFGEMILLVGVVGTSLASVITIALLKGDFEGGCPLYPTISDGGDKVFIVLNDVSNCNYVITFNAIALLAVILIGLPRAMELMKKKKSITGSTIFQFVIVILCAVIALLALVSACIVTVGFKDLCDGMVSYYPYSRCVDFQRSEWEYYDGSNFYDYLSAAQVASWLSFLFWLLVGVASFLLLTFLRQTSRPESVPT